MKRLAALIALALLLTVAGCSAGETTVTAKDAGRTVRLDVGDVLVVTLEGNPTTGYSWNGGADPAVVVLSGEPEFKAESDLVGAGGVMTLRFEAVEAGEGTLKLDYSRAWESVQPLETFELKLVVSK